MQVSIFSRNSIGDKIVIERIFNSTGLKCTYLGEKVDLSKITEKEDNLIIILNRITQYINIKKILKIIDKDTEKPLMVVTKLRTFGALFLKEDYKIDKIATNKIYPFAGILYVPKKYMKNRMSDIFKSIDENDMRFSIVDNRRNK